MGGTSFVRLFVFDIDQTLIPRGTSELRQAEIGAIRKLLAQGDAVCLASGRPFVSLKHFLDEFGPGKKYLICANGAAAYDEEGNCISSSCISLKDLLYLNQKYGSEKVYVYGYDTNSGLAIFYESIFSEIEVNLCRIDPKDFTFVKGDGSDDETMPLFKIVIASDEVTSSKLIIDAKDRERYLVNRSDPCFIEVLHQGIDKSVRVDKLRELLGLSAGDVYCFGDNGNDATMVAKFHGIAMANATEECKAGAEFITKSCDEHGVPYALKNILKVID